MDWGDSIHADPAILGGTPVVKGTRRSAELVLDLFAGGGRGKRCGRSTRR